MPRAAIKDLREAVSLSEPGAQRALQQGFLGVGMLRRQRSGATDAEACEILRQSVLAEAGSATVRAMTAVAWGNAAASCGDRKQGLGGLSRAVSLLDLAVFRGLARHDRQRVLEQFSGLGSDAAALAIDAGEYAQAVELIEQGRGVLQTQSLEARRRFGDLQKEAPTLATRLVAIHAALEPSLETSLTSPNGLGLPGKYRVADMNDLAQEREDLLVEIRQRPGFGNFLRPLPFSTLRGAARDGPVVIINISQYRSDALIVTSVGCGSCHFRPQPCSK
jgi:hypothetical protein